MTTTREAMREAYEPTDNELARDALSNPEAFGMLYDRHLPRIHSYFTYALGNEETTQKATENTFLNALESLSEFAPEQHISFRAWLWGFAYQTAQATDKILPFSTTQQVNQGNETITAIRTLPHDEQHILLLTFTAGLSIPEIGYVMEKDLTEIEEKKIEALKMLRKKLGPTIQS